MRIRLQTQQSQGANWLKYGGAIVLALAFLVFLGILLFSSVSVPIIGSKCVAIVNIDQEITTESVPPTLFSTAVPGSEEIASSIAALETRDDVGSVVFVMNSPGGSVVATKEIYEAVKNLSKPKVAYFREIAASGAYYISTGADYIVSEPDAITGSIGVIMTVTELSGLFDKLGINSTAIKSGESKDIGSPERPMTDNEKQILQALVDEIFGEFRSIVVANRGSRLDMDRFEEILDGRIVSGRQAKAIGLVDALGNKRDAIMKAAALAGIGDEEPLLCEIDTSSHKTGLFDVRTYFAGILAQDTKKFSVKYE